jgi:hypothetical protein
MRGEDECQSAISRGNKKEGKVKCEKRGGWAEYIIKPSTN